MRSQTFRMVASALGGGRVREKSRSCLYVVQSDIKAALGVELNGRLNSDQNAECMGSYINSPF